MSDLDPLSITRPAQLARLFDRAWSQVTIGRSGASVWRIQEDGSELFLKAAPMHGPDRLPDEVARLDWLSTVGVPAPRVLDFFEAEGLHWLLMTAVTGVDLTSLVQQPTTLSSALATGLRRLHAVDPASCSFDHRLPRRLEAAAVNVTSGWVDETDFDDDHAGWRAEAVLDWVRSHQPDRHDLVVTHGDASLPNVMARDGIFSGIIDCGRLGIADRWQDLALACRSIIYNCGQEHVAPFLAAYGAEWDPERYRYYCALDELF